MLGFRFCSIATILHGMFLYPRLLLNAIGSAPVLFLPMLKRKEKLKLARRLSEIKLVQTWKLCPGRFPMVSTWKPILVKAA